LMPSFLQLKKFPRVLEFLLPRVLFYFHTAWPKPKEEITTTCIRFSRLKTDHFLSLMRKVFPVPKNYLQFLSLFGKQFSIYAALL
jgi:hypothetical protein